MGPNDNDIILTIKESAGKRKCLSVMSPCINTRDLVSKIGMKWKSNILTTSLLEEKRKTLLVAHSHDDTGLIPRINQSSNMLTNAKSYWCPAA